MKVDYLIIGAGPAGLAFAGNIKNVLGPNKTFLVVDMGKHVDARDHEDPKDIPCGAGGAGCYSDGKFSYFPAGTNVWKLCYPLITEAYADLASDMIRFSGTGIPPIPTETEIRDYFFEIGNYWKLKKYPTTYIDLNGRKKLIAHLVKKVGIENMMMETRFTSIKKLSENNLSGPALRASQSELRSSGPYKCSLEQRSPKSLSPKNQITKLEVITNNIIFAGGRFSPLQLSEFSEVSMKFRRYEFGVRLEANASNEVMSGYEDFVDIIDPKFRYQFNQAVEFRTFCWCRNGEAIISEYDGIRTYSGRSDCAPTNKSNFGFLVRIVDPEAFPENEYPGGFTEDDFYEISTMNPFDIQLKVATETNVLKELYGNYIGTLLKQALVSIVTEFPALITTESHILGPSIEGIGYYPDLDHNLKLRTLSRNQIQSKPGDSIQSNTGDSIQSNAGESIQSNAGESIYCLGDCTGIFRGIIPCMLSGYYLAHSLKMNERNITLVTGNMNKVREIEQLLGPIKHSALDLPEFQGSPEEITREKCRLAAKKIGGAVIVEDTSLIFNALGSGKLPGPYIKWFLESMGCENLVKLLTGFDDKSGYVECVFAYSDGPDDPVPPRIFVGITSGSIVEPRGNRNFGWDPIFQPDGYQMTYAEMDDGAKNKISHRYKAIKLLRDHLIYHNPT